jgi:hypothetical protein
MSEVQTGEGRVPTVLIDRSDDRRHRLGAIGIRAAERLQSTIANRHFGVAQRSNHL